MGKGISQEPLMTYRGKVKNGVVVLEGPRVPPEGSPVSVRVLKGSARRTTTGGKASSPAYERYKRFIGMAEGLPPDFSINHDHYLYGVPKRK
jgi:hypothetical protein